MLQDDLGFTSKNFKFQVKECLIVAQIQYFAKEFSIKNMRF